MARPARHVSAGGWPLSFGTKAETLARLSSRLKHASVLPSTIFTVEAWVADRDAVLADLSEWFDRSVIVRSSALQEDDLGGSMAGRFRSVPSVVGPQALAEAIDVVVSSYGRVDAGDQVFVQPMLSAVRLSGVAFSREPSSGAPYFVISCDRKSGSTDAVTSGRSSDIQTLYCHRTAEPDREEYARVVHLLRELETLLPAPALDIEFAMTTDGELVLLQVRPLAVYGGAAANDAGRGRALELIERTVAQGIEPHPYLFGRRTVYGVMPDWNPAEIIGVRPRPLALSLYRDLITDSIWAYQRNNYGYKNLRSFPLLVSFSGLPYIDVRVSFNSFLPDDLDADLSERLVNYYIQRLIDAPGCHDKVEFEIIFSCYTLDLPDRLAPLAAHGFSGVDRERLADSLRRLTNGIIHGQTGLWREDIARIAELERRRTAILSSPLATPAKIYWLLEDCKRYGTLPFAGLARAGFIAVQLLKSLVTTSVIGPDDYQRFMNALETVGSRMALDFTRMEREVFLQQYGHLRPGTYDILSPRYDEVPDRYFDWAAPRGAPAEPLEFALSLPQLNRTSALLRDHGIEHDAVGLFNFIKAAIEGREYSKFVFTRSLSDALVLLGQLGESCGLSVDDCAYIDIQCLHRLYASSDEVARELKRSVAEGRERYEATRQIMLPPLIVEPSDVWAFELSSGDPSFITLRSATGPVAFVGADTRLAKDSILLIPSADPGYDWIFAHGVAGFITMYGGANSHMAIRAGELGIPAVIGAGEVLFKRWSSAHVLQVDCANRQVRVVR